jgi:hypothetical protein
MKSNSIRASKPTTKEDTRGMEYDKKHVGLIVEEPNSSSRGFTISTEMDPKCITFAYV